MYCIKVFSALFVLIIFARSTAYAVERNDSNIHIRDRDVQVGVSVRLPEDVRICQGTVPNNVDLNSIHLTADDLKKGIDCLVGDFDGNRFLDFILYGKRAGDENPRSLALFYNGSSVAKTQVIDAVLDLFKYTDPERKNYPKYKNVPGLIKHAEGDAGIVYFFDLKKGLFRKVPYIYPKGYEMGD